MKNGRISRAEAIEIVGVEAVEAVDAANCEPTGRVGYNGECQDDDLTEWSASVGCNDIDGNSVVLVAYYYTTNQQDATIAETGDGSSIDWVISGYEIE